MTTEIRDDLVIPFQLEGLDVRGRIVRMGTSVETVLTQHNYPAAVSNLLGEALVLVALLGASLKFQGMFTMQAKGNGPVSMLVADYDVPGNVRGFAQFDHKLVEELDRTASLSLKDLMGEGYLALTIDQGADMERYQGIVELAETNLSDCALRYFSESEQIPTNLKLSVGRLSNEKGQFWRAGGILIQNLANVGGKVSGLTPEEKEEGWNRGKILLETAEDHELLDPLLKPEELLFRLYHEDGVRVFDPVDIEFACRCERQRVEAVLLQYEPAELTDMLENEKITARCEFCSTVYSFDLEELEQKRDQKED